MSPADVVERANRLRLVLGEGALDELIAITREHLMQQWAATGDDQSVARERLHARVRALDDIKSSFNAALGAGVKTLANIAARKAVDH